MNDIKPNKAKLTRKQTKFVAEIISNPTISTTQAAKDAGYSEKTAASIGSENLKKPEIQAAIEDSKAKVLQKVEYSLAQWLTDVREVKERCMQQIEVLDKLGHKTGLYKFDARGATDALDKLAKHFSFYAPEKINLSGDINIHESQIVAKEKEEVERRIKEIYAGNRIAQYIPKS
jgi:phage terminase small subunit